MAFDYQKYPHMIKDLLHMERVVEVETLIGANTNVHHRVWFSDDNNDREGELFQFINAMNMIVHNEQSEWKTFESTSGASSNIDVTMGSQGTEGRIYE